MTAAMWFMEANKMIYAVINWFCWGVFALIWLGGIAYNALFGPQILRRETRSYGWFWAIGIIIAWWLMRYNPHIWFRLHFNVPELQIAGSILLIAGTLFAVWSRLVLGVMWSSAATLKHDHQLRTDGPYRITRHPIYTGMLAMITGSTLASMVGLPIFFLFLVILCIKIPSEEKLMTEQFGDQYLDYKKHTPRLIPGLRKW
jgi:isoprenylcysteine carboxyl methyltransferase (ICMT) family protein YpbQ